MSGILTMEKCLGDLALRRWSSDFLGHHFDLETLLNCSLGLRARKSMPCRSGIRAEWGCGFTATHWLGQWPRSHDGGGRGWWGWAAVGIPSLSTPSRGSDCREPQSEGGKRLMMQGQEGNTLPWAQEGGTWLVGLLVQRRGASLPRLLSFQEKRDRRFSTRCEGEEGWGGLGEGRRRKWASQRDRTASPAQGGVRS